MTGYWISKQRSDKHSKLVPANLRSPLILERRTFPKKSIDRIRIGKSRKFSSKGSSSPYRKLVGGSERRSADSHENNETTKKKVFKKERFNKGVLGRIRAEIDTGRLGSEKNYGRDGTGSPAARRVVEGRRLVNFSKAK